jgi:thioredoxin 1
MSSFAELIEGDKPVLIDFYADWCQPCKMMAPILKEVAQKMGDRVKILKIDVDRNPKLAQSLQIQGVPTLVIYRYGKSVWRQSGVVPAHALIPLLEDFASQT